MYLARVAKSGEAGDKPQILKLCEQEHVRFLRLQFTDILGSNKNVEVPESQFDKALDGEIMFDGSSIEGFVRIEESDMLLRPDLSTFRIFPWDEDHGRVARVICDIARPDGSPFDGCPRTVLRRVTDDAAKLGFTSMLGPEAEFFLFQRDPSGAPSTDTHDRGAYFDLTPIDKGEECRRGIVVALESMVVAKGEEIAGEGQAADAMYIYIYIICVCVYVYIYIICVCVYVYVYVYLIVYICIYPCDLMCGCSI